MLKHLLLRWYQALIFGSVAFVAGALATPLALTYSIAPNGPGSFNYTFQLILDNHDGSWLAGQSFNWIVFGDVPAGDSPLANFVGNSASLPVGPFDAYDVTSGGGSHNGPTFLSFSGDGWVPGSIGGSLAWSGTSSTFVGQGELRFSNLAGTGAHADFDVAQLQAVPEPATYLFLVAGFAVLALVRRHRWSASRVHLCPQRANVAPTLQ